MLLAHHMQRWHAIEPPLEASVLPVMQPESQVHLDATAQLLGVDSNGLLKALTTRTRQTVEGVPFSNDSICGLLWVCNMKHPPLSVGTLH